MTAPNLTINRPCRVAAVLLLASLGVMLAASGTARADHLSIYSFPKFERSAQVAVNAWDGYLDHCPYVYFYAYEGWEHPDAVDASAFAYLGECNVYFNADDSSNYRYAWFCSVAVHEVGHVAGFDHSPDSRDILHATNEVYWRWCFKRKRARQLVRRGEILDFSIADWSGNSASAHGGADEHEGDAEITEGELSDALESGDVHVDLLTRVATR
jgi:hypothetical protein